MTMTELAKWEEYKNFSKHEFDCRETGENRMTHVFMTRLQSLRDAYGKPMKVTSGYRSPNHPIERGKSTPGTHAQGIAVDIGVSGADAVELLQMALEIGFTGIGINQKGDRRFLHFDLREMPMIWSYA